MGALVDFIPDKEIDPIPINPLEILVNPVARILGRILLSRFWLRSLIASFLPKRCLTDRTIPLAPFEPAFRCRTFYAFLLLHDGAATGRTFRDALFAQSLLRFVAF